MDHPWSPNWDQGHTAPGIGPSYWPGQRWQKLPTPPVFSPRGRMSPPPRTKNTISTEVVTSSYRIQSLAAGNRKVRLDYIHKCVQKFHDFHSGKGAFRSRVGGDELLHFKIPITDFIEFKKLLYDDEEQEGLPNYEYDSSSAVLTTQFSVSPMHGKVVSTVMKGFILSLSKLPPSVEKRIDMVCNQKFIAFEGMYKGSAKIPDLALQTTTDKGIREVKFVTEVGLSESYEKLVSDARLWLQGTQTVSLVLLVKLEETPNYKCPVRNLDGAQLAELGFPPLNKVMGEPFVLVGPYGPAMYKGLMWVGEVSGFIEFWGRDPNTRLATCLTSRVDLCEMKNNLESGLWLSEMIDIGDEPNEEIFFDWPHFLGGLGGCIRETAANRCYAMLLDAEERAGELDGNYQPPSPASSA